MGSKQHKEAGAAFAVEQKNPLLMFAVLGHHHGIPDKAEAVVCVKSSDGDGFPVWNSIRHIAMRECPELELMDLIRAGSGTKDHELITRLLLSCLVDADWSDTSEHERHYRGWPQYPHMPALAPSARLAHVLSAIAARSEQTKNNNPALTVIRRQILDACIVAAKGPRGLFTLTVPTGGGKTLSSLAFALKHAAVNDLRRVIYVAPYISILDQNAAVIRAALGVTRHAIDVFEHQSLAEPQGSQNADEKQASSAARRAENWDSPVVITTNVQFFESLFSNKPGRCRKLHNIARSVVILDECQTLPPDLVQPTCQMLKQLVDQLGCSIVLCTATQPAFDHEKLNEHRLSATEIIPPEMKLFDCLKRVQLEWPPSRDARLGWPEVATRMTANHSALCVVNTKKAALDLFAELKSLSQDVFHLSTNLCPAHRLSVLDTVKRRLERNQPAFVVSTQLIEAGVDVDFPFVFREMAPLEAIIQAAGRCNREGRIPAPVRPASRRSPAR
jgi:CRISPR-associated endonuclease/helicase Cas3